MTLAAAAAPGEQQRNSLAVSACDFLSPFNGPQ